MVHHVARTIDYLSFTYLDCESASVYRSLVKVAPARTRRKNNNTMEKKKLVGMNDFCVYYYDEC